MRFFTTLVTLSFAAGKCLNETEDRDSPLAFALRVFENLSNATDESFASAFFKTGPETLAFALKGVSIWGRRNYYLLRTGHPSNHRLNETDETNCFHQRMSKYMQILQDKVEEEFEDRVGLLGDEFIDDVLIHIGVLLNNEIELEQIDYSALRKAPSFLIYYTPDILKRARESPRINGNLTKIHELRSYITRYLLEIYIIRSIRIGVDYSGRELAHKQDSLETVIMDNYDILEYIFRKDEASYTRAIYEQAMAEFQKPIATELSEA